MVIKKGIKVESVLNVERLKKKFNLTFLQTKNYCILVYTSVHENFFGVHEIFSVHETSFGVHEFLSSRKNLNEIIVIFLRSRQL